MSQRAARSGASAGGRRGQRAFFAAGFVLAALALAFIACGGGGSDDDDDTPSAAETGTAVRPTPTQAPITPIFPQDTPGAVSSPTPKPLRTVDGEPEASIEEQDISITLETIDDPWKPPEGATQPDEGKRFVAFVLTVQNNGDFPLGLFVQHFTLEDSDGNSYETTPAAGSDPRLFYEALNGGDAVTASIAFELDEAAAIGVLKYRPRVPGAGEIGFEFS